MDSEDIVTKCHQKRSRIRDPRSGIRKKFIPDPGGKKHRIRIRNTGASIEFDPIGTYEI
jgi:hypothetical protein